MGKGSGPKRLLEVLIQSEVVGVAKWRIINNLVKGSSMRKKLQNSKGYAESSEYLPALGLFISRRSPSLQFEVNLILHCKKKACNAHQIWCATFVLSGTPYNIMV